ncbi:hypothetical protein Fcan01_18205 [Folsomia candida]|uniref:Uncharacterized protein n=1 Tax=Folsomia candida TaxID=158441 RepID=A0A226DN77_FOLCA|nr:hypothetical protein Fcan01_18205 [Folsomia candida]
MKIVVYCFLSILSNNVVLSNSMDCHFYQKWTGDDPAATKIHNFHVLEGTKASVLFTWAGCRYSSFVFKPSRAQGTYGYNGVKITLLDIVWKGNCVENLKSRAPMDHKCVGRFYEIEIMAAVLNFTVVEKNVHGNVAAARPTYIFQNAFLTTDYNVWEIQSLAYFLEIVPIVVYCRKHTLFPTTWTVWLTPFHWTVWVAILVVMLVAPFHNMSHINDVRSVLLEIYFMFSYLLREPVKNFTVGHTLTALICLIIPLLYESLIVGEVIAPTKPVEYHNVAEFLDAFDKIILPTGSRYAPESMVQYEFEKFNISDNLSTFMRAEHFPTFFPGQGIKRVLLFLCLIRRDTSFEHNSA